MASSAYSWNPAPDPARSTAAHQRRPDRGNLVGRNVGHAVIEGRVRNVDKGMPINNQAIVHFRVEQFDRDGTRRRMVSVQYTSSGGSFGGKDLAIHDGDLVRVHGQWDDGSIVAQRVENLTTGASSKAPKPFSPLKLVMIGAAVLLVPIVIFLIGTFAVIPIFEKHERDTTSSWCQDMVDAGMQPPASQCGTP
ncbi:hypothetical protein [Mycobacterium shimoidei]|uniref:Uncharacterized protein n=1 Tax=Mycobacterium shimoidei TaxID=29313 RepID=A0A1E3TC81_MYCSH|nr:hypothetical protein [Mycobacterium shimoidei]MCV7260849.1 hypothetical protein [Mycobacterium shimoidei]ODR12036.1 hypothetical protein BHQ16_17485 [Mycobacterium shimoidei]ORW79400.1 hypothetical protein AWC26_15245 [Mycobacterium shimoidei]SRX93032.1 hypothetical protein MSP7336_01262 [Mycobacterium shimoidei]